MLPTIPLSNAYLFSQLFKQPLLPQAIQRRKQIPVTGTARFNLLYKVLHSYYFIGVREFFIPDSASFQIIRSFLCEHPDPGMLKIGRTGAELFRHLNIWHFLNTVVEQAADVSIHEYRIPRDHDTVLHNRIATVLKVQITADVIHHNEVLTDALCQMCNRTVQPHRMKMSFLRIWQKTFHILQSTGNLCLTMALEHRYIDQKIDILHTAAKLQL